MVVGRRKQPAMSLLWKLSLAPLIRVDPGQRRFGALLEKADDEDE